jgi:hypothetical protein
MVRLHSHPLTINVTRVISNLKRFLFLEENAHTLTQVFLMSFNNY